MHSPDGSTLDLRAVRYAKSVTVHVELRQDESAGHIYPPYVSVRYAVAAVDDYLAYENVSVSCLILLRKGGCGSPVTEAWELE